MASKRQRGESSKSSKSYDKKLFVNKEASDIYHKVLASKKLISERGLRPHENDGEVGDMIMERGWYNLTNQPEPAVEAVVKEFYANAKAIQNHVKNPIQVVTVRGKDISFDKVTINTFYNILDMQTEDDYTAYRRDRLNVNEVIRCLCRPAANWIYKGGEPRYFSHSHLSRYGKAWYYFLCAKLMPTTHVSEVIKERATLLYCLVNGKSIDVGRVIKTSIDQAIKGGSTSGLPHPSLIFGLCQQAGVLWNDEELIHHPKSLIDHHKINHFKVWSGAPSNNRGAGFVLRGQSPDTEELFAESPPPTATSSLQSPMEVLTNEVHQLRQETMQIHRETRHQTRRMDNMAQRMDSILQFNADFAATMAQAFERWGFTAGPTPLHFPMPPIVPAFPPDSPDNATDY